VTRKNSLYRIGLTRQESRAIAGEQSDAAVNFDIELYSESIMERLCTLNTATLSTRTHLAPKPAETHWITFRGHSRSRILGSLKSLMSL